MSVLLVVDDEPSILHAFRRFFRAPELTLLTAQSSAEGLARVSQHAPDVVILDVQLGDQSGLETFRRIREIDDRIPVIFITGHGTTDTAIEAVKLGAYDYLFKPLDLSQLRSMIARALEIRRLMQGASGFDAGKVAQPVADAFIGRCPAMKDVYTQIGRVAVQDVTVLIVGETGTGKELVARAIRKHSRRCEKPFLEMNCAAIPETLLESELFGYEPGAFTGATQQKCGKFEQCSDGTLFLDEIGDMTPLAQSKVLRVLQSQTFERVGGNETIQTDVRLIAATNRDLEQLVSEGKFREDLFYRLSVFTIRLPPLRERGDDLELLLRHFLRRFNAEFERDVRQVPQETLDLLQQYQWPGNVRELQSVIQQALLHATGPVLAPDFLPPSVRDQSVTATDATESSETSSCDLSSLGQFVADRLESGSQSVYAEVTELVDRRVISQLLEFTGGNLAQTARLLGITRNTLRSKIRSLGLSVDRSERSRNDQPE